MDEIVPRLGKLLRPRTYLRFMAKGLREMRLTMNPNLRGSTLYPPGHFYSPLLDIRNLLPTDQAISHDGSECWEQVQLNDQKQRLYYQELLDQFSDFPFPARSTSPYRYYTENVFFPASDAFTTSGIIRKEKPRRIVEVGSGFSSAVMLDTLDQAGTAALTFIEPFPERLRTLLSPDEISSSSLLVHPVQEVPLSVFDQLEAHDILFIDSSHVAKIGSDVAFLLLRILPRLKRGVLVHFHDIFYPFSYPMDWIRNGRAWNESLFLRAFLIGNRDFEVMAFNSYMGHSHPDLFRDRFPDFLRNTGGSIWLRKVA
jgi:hypothetical protein